MHLTPNRVQLRIKLTFYYPETASNTFVLRHSVVVPETDLFPRFHYSLRSIESCC